MGIEAAILSEIFSGKKAIPEKRLGSEARINKQGSQSTITIINQKVSNMSNVVKNYDSELQSDNSKSVLSGQSVS